jgi:hypothetical protein
MEVKLLDRVRGAIRARHYSRRTEEAYVHWIRRYIVFHRKTHPSEMGVLEVTAFLTWLAVDPRVSASTQNHARPQSRCIGGPQSRRSSMRGEVSWGLRAERLHITAPGHVADVRGNCCRRRA